MGVKKYKPVTPGQRGMTGYTFEEITKSRPERSLIQPLRWRSQLVWPYNCTPSWWWSPPIYPYGGFQARKVWYSGACGRDRI
jgi:hypothetical protein